MKYFPSATAEICWATSPHHGNSKAIWTIPFSWPLIPCQVCALPLSHWNGQTSPCFCINYQGIMQVLGHTHSSHHTVLLRKAAWWKSKQNQTLQQFNKTQRFKCAHPQRGQSKLVWVQDWCWSYTQWVGNLGILPLFKDLGQVSWMLLLGDNAASSNWATEEELTLMCK